MRSKASAIQEQLERAQGKRAAPEPVAASGRATPRAKKAEGRAGKVHLGAYLDPDFRKSLRMVQAQTDKDMQELMAEAFNDLFRKYKVPVVGS
jgi:nicotinamide mononucleotide (NMN) deamidase PncC